MSTHTNQIFKNDTVCIRYHICGISVQIIESILLLYMSCNKHTITILIIYHDFSLHQGEVVMSSQITHHLAHILDTCALIFCSCAHFTVYPNRITQRHPTSVQVITTRARKSGSKEYRAEQKWPHPSVICSPGLSTIFHLWRILHSYFCVAQGQLHIIHPA